MIERKKIRQSYYDIEQILDDVKENATRITDRENPTASEVLGFMIGENHGFYGGEYNIYKYKEKTKKTFLQRINVFWFYPLFALSVPFQYILTGNYGIKRHSKSGRIVDRLVGFDE